jgi:hypothetical protein
MSKSLATRQFSDGDLRSYVTGIASPDLQHDIEAAVDIESSLADRIAALDPWSDVVRDAVGAIPVINSIDRVAQAYAEAVATTSRPVIAAARNTAGWYWATALGVLGAGFAWWFLTQREIETLPPMPAVETTIPQTVLPPQDKTKSLGETAPLVSENAPAKDPTWRDAVTDYVKLMTAETFTTKQSPDQIRISLDAAQKAVGVDVSQLVRRVPDLAFQRAEILVLNGRPLVQLAFLDAKQNVVAICVLSRKVKPANLPADTLSPTKAETVKDHSVVHWDYNTHGFLVISRDSTENVMAIAKRVAVPL